MAGLNFVDHQGLEKDPDGHVSSKLGDPRLHCVCQIILFLAVTAHFKNYIEIQNISFLKSIAKK